MEEKNYQPFQSLPENPFESKFFEERYQIEGEPGSYNREGERLIADESYFLRNFLYEGNVPQKETFAKFITHCKNTWMMNERVQERDNYKDTFKVNIYLRGGRCFGMGESTNREYAIYFAWFAVYDAMNRSPRIRYFTFEESHQQIEFIHKRLAREKKLESISTS